MHPKTLTCEEERGKLTEIIARMGFLYQAINSHHTEFIDRYFPKFKVSEKEGDFNRWAYLDDVAVKYLHFIDWNLGHYHDNYDDFESWKPQPPSSDPQEFQKYQQQKNTVDLFYQQWQESKKEFMQSNVGLVVDIAKQYGKKLPLEDCIQNGIYGLSTAVDRFDLSRGYKFSTYASWWIRHSVVRQESDTARTIRLPAYVEAILRKVKQAQSALQQKKECPYVSVEEIAEVTEIAQDDVVVLLQHEEPLSLDLPHPGKEGSYTYYDLLEDKTANSISDLVFKTQIKRILSGSLESTLTKRELDLIKKRFGFEGEPQTLQQLGAQYGVSRQRIKQLEARVLRKLAKNQNLQEIYEALE